MYKPVHISLAQFSIMGYNYFWGEILNICINHKQQQTATAQSQTVFISNVFSHFFIFLFFSNNTVTSSAFKITSEV